MIKNYSSHSPILVDKIENLMILLSGVQYVEQLSKRKVNAVYRNILPKQTFIDLYCLADYRETLLRKNILSSDYMARMAEIVESIALTNPPLAISLREAA